jgi:hypothetical protein
MGQYGHLIIGAVNEAEKALLPNKLMITMTQTMALPFTMYSHSLLDHWLNSAFPPTWRVFISFYPFVTRPSRVLS